MPSPIKEVGISLLDIIDQLAKPWITNSITRKFWDWFFISHAKKAVLGHSDLDLKIALQKGYEKLKPIFENKDFTVQIIEGEKLGSPKIARIGEIKKIMNIEMTSEEKKKAGELLSELMLKDGN